MHRNATNNGLILTSGAEQPSSSTDTFGFGFGRSISLIVRYDTRVRIHASYGCTIRVGYSEATVTGGGFFHGGVRVDTMPDCRVGSWIDIVAEDWRLLQAGKKRLLFDHTCGIVPLCTEPPPPPPPPTGPAHPPSPTTPPERPPHQPPPPSPPPFPPGTVLNPFPPSVASPPSPKAPTSTVELGSTSMALLALAGAGLLAFGGLQFYFMAWFRVSAAAARKKAALVPVARIDTNGKATVVAGVAVGTGRGGFEERQSLLTGQKF